MRAATHRRAGDRLAELVSSHILDRKLFAPVVLPTIIRAVNLRDDHDGPGKLLVIGDTGMSLRLTEKIVKGVALAVDEELPIAREIPLDQHGDKIVLMALADNAAGHGGDFDAVGRRDKLQAIDEPAAGNVVDGV